MLKNGTSDHDPAVCCDWNCSHIGEYAARPGWRSDACFSVPCSTATEPGPPGWYL